MSANIEGATITMPAIQYEALQRERNELQQQADLLQARLRERGFTTPPEIKRLVVGIEGARRVVGFAMSHLGAAVIKGWPVAELRQFIEGMRVISPGAVHIQEAVNDFEAFAVEIDEAEKVRQARALGITPALDASSDLIVDRILREAELGPQPFEAAVRAEALVSTGPAQVLADQTVTVQAIGEVHAQQEIDEVGHFPDSEDTRRGRAPDYR